MIAGVPITAFIGMAPVGRLSDEWPERVILGLPADYQGPAADAVAGTDLPIRSGWRLQAHASNW